MQERRRVSRKPVTSARGKIVLPDLKPAHSCKILELSAGGARVELAGLAFLPTRFYLLIPTTQFLREAEISWRDGRVIGLRFVARAIDLATTMDPQYRHLRAA